MDKYKSIDNETELINRINELDKIAKQYFVDYKGDIYWKDLFLLSIIDKSAKLINPFLLALKERNITMLAILTRVQMDCVLHSFAISLVKNNDNFCKEVLTKNLKIKHIKDIENKNLTDKYLCEKLGEHLKMPIYDIYEWVCGYVHFSAYSFYDISEIKELENGKISFSMNVGRQNDVKKAQKIEEISLNLANHFLFFGYFLIHHIWGAWLRDKQLIEFK